MKEIITEFFLTALSPTPILARNKINKINEIKEFTMDSAAARTKLLNDPAGFLKYYPVKCGGAPAPSQNAANLRPYFIEKQNAAGGGNKLGHSGATRPILLGPLKWNISSFKLNTVNSNNGTQINNAHVVPMVNYNSDKYNCHNLNETINAMPYYALDATGDGLMVTGELSNCCFTWLAQGADLWCIHVQPVGDKARLIGGPTQIMPNELQNDINATGRFAAAQAAALSTFGRNDYPNGRASVIGVRRNGVWKLYAQTSDDSFKTLSGAYKIYPGPITPL